MGYYTNREVFSVVQYQDVLQSHYLVKGIRRALKLFLFFYVLSMVGVYFLTYAGNLRTAGLEVFAGISFDFFYRQEISVALRWDLGLLVFMSLTLICSAPWPQTPDRFYIKGRNDQIESAKKASLIYGKHVRYGLLQVLVFAIAVVALCCFLLVTFIYVKTDAMLASFVLTLLTGLSYRLSIRNYEELHREEVYGDENANRPGASGELGSLEDNGKDIFAYAVKWHENNGADRYGRSADELNRRLLPRSRVDTRNPTIIWCGERFNADPKELRVRLSRKFALGVLCGLYLVVHFQLLEALFTNLFFVMGLPYHLGGIIWVGMLLGTLAGAFWILSPGAGDRCLLEPGSYVSKSLYYQSEPSVK